MLRISITKEGDVEIFDLEGKLCGEWVRELERCWRESSAQAGITFQVNLKAVSYVDPQGKSLLAEMYARGADIKGCGCMTRALVEEIVRDAEHKSE